MSSSLFRTPFETSKHASLTRSVPALACPTPRFAQAGRPSVDPDLGRDAYFRSRQIFPAEYFPTKYMGAYFKLQTKCAVPQGAAGLQEGGRQHWQHRGAPLRAPLPHPARAFRIAENPNRIAVAKRIAFRRSEQQLRESESGGQLADPCPARCRAGPSRAVNGGLAGSRGLRVPRHGPQLPRDVWPLRERGTAGTRTGAGAPLPPRAEAPHWGRCWPGSWRGAGRIRSRLPRLG